MSGEHPTPDVIKKSITNPETGGTLTVVHRRDQLAATAGHLFGLPLEFMVGPWSAVGKEPSPEMIDQILDRWKDVPWKGEVVVRLGHTDPKEEWERTKKRLQEEGKLNWFADKISYPVLFAHSLKNRLSRISSFSPFTRTITVMNADLAVAMHELGHAEDLLGTGKKLRFFDQIPRENRASHNAIKRMKTDDERLHGMRVLEPRFATYVGGAAQLIGTLLGLPVWSKELYAKDLIKTTKGTVRFRIQIPYAYLGSIALAHIASRLPWRKSSFGYIFSGEAGSGSGREGKHPEPILKPHQVLVATAGAKG